VLTYHTNFDGDKRKKEEKQEKVSPVEKGEKKDFCSDQNF
jgi:hypothetical protein